VLNAAARLIHSARKHDHISPLLNDLHRLRVPQRIEFKLAVLVYRCFCGNVPVMRRSTIGDRSFSVAAARIWNSLPADVTSAPSLLVFRRLLKKELCRRSFPDN